MNTDAIYISAGINDVTYKDSQDKLVSTFISNCQHLISECELVNPKICVVFTGFYSLDLVKYNRGSTKYAHEQASLNRVVIRICTELGRLNGSAGLQTPRIDHCIHKYHSNTIKMSHFLHKLHDGCHPRGLIVDETIDCIKRAVCVNVNNGKHR